MPCWASRSQRRGTRQPALVRQHYRLDAVTPPLVLGIRPTWVFTIVSATRTCWAISAFANPWGPAAAPVADQNMAPLARTVCPETHAAASLTSQPTTGAMSAGWPSLLHGLWCVAAAIDSGVSAAR
jgi:hypothetical protein